jgi:multiple sugar transport system permease protein
MKKRNKNKKLAGIITRTFLALIFSIFFLLPIILTITNSFMSTTEISSNYGKVFSSVADESGSTYIGEKVNLKFIPDIVSFEQYWNVLLKSPEYLLKFWNSVIYVVPITLFQLFVAALAAYSFTRFSGKKKTILFFVYIILMLMPYQVTLVPNYMVSKWLHILNTRWAIWLPGIMSPFSVYLLTKFMKRIPEATIEAAKIDGAGEWRIFWNICLPLCKSSLFSVGILVFVDYWNMVEQPLVLLQDSDLHPLSIFLSQINTGETGLAFAVATIYMIPNLLLFFYGEDYLVEGISSQSGLK